MLAKIDKFNCLGCSLCVLTCPEMFRIESDCLAGTVLQTIPHELLPKVEEAARQCPTGAILLVQEEG